MPDKGETTDSNEPYLVWLQYVLGLNDLPYTVSTSYGDDEQTVPLSYAQRVCQDFAQLGARGVTVLFSAGDDGVVPNGTCVANDGSNRKTRPRTKVRADGSRTGRERRRRRGDALHLDETLNRKQKPTPLPTVLSDEP